MKNMTYCMRTLLVAALATLCLAYSTTASATVLTLTSGLNLNRNSPYNLITDGSFEDRGNNPPYTYWATGTNNTPFAVPPGWTSGGGPSNYAAWGDMSNTAGPLPDGTSALYFGNQFASSISETPTFHPDGTVTFLSPPTITPRDASFTPAVTLSQKLTLIPGATYAMSFWAGGESAAGGCGWGHDGMFALDVTGAPTVFLAAPSGCSNLGSSHVYDFLLTPSDSDITITFTNWGHFGDVTEGWNLGSTTELVLDDVILNSAPEPGSLLLLASGGITLAGVVRRRLFR